MPSKDVEIEQPIPVEWRSVIADIVGSIRMRTLQSKNGSGFEVSVDPDEIENIYQNVEAYGDPLERLPEDTWETSVCRWMGIYWHLLIDLFTAKEGLSDLVLFVEVYERSDDVLFKIKSVHVP